MPTPDRQSIITATATSHDRHIDPRLLRVYVTYRLMLAILFLAIVQLQLAPNYLGSNNHQLFSLTTSIYCIINIGTAALFHLQHWKPSETSIFAMLFVDTIVLTTFRDSRDPDTTSSLWSAEIKVGLDKVGLDKVGLDKVGMFGKVTRERVGTRRLELRTSTMSWRHPAYKPLIYIE